MAVDPTIETAPNVVILEASHARRGFAISWIAQTLVTDGSVKAENHDPDGLLYRSLI